MNHNQTHHPQKKRAYSRTRKIRPLPILLAGIFTWSVFIAIATFFLGSIAYFFQLQIEKLSGLSAITYLLAIYISSLLVSFIAGHRYILLPIINGFLCFILSLLPLAVNHVSITENFLPKLALAAITAFAAYLTVKLVSIPVRPQRQRVPIRERNRTIEIR